MLIGVPPACALFMISWGFLCLKFLRKGNGTDLELIKSRIIKKRNKKLSKARKWHSFVVSVTFLATVILWALEFIHKINAPVIAFFAVSVLCVSGIINTDDFRSLPWDVLMLMAGGLALGVGVTQTGLSSWLISFIPAMESEILLIMSFCFVAVIMSNIMSNTAAASILIPIVAAAQVASPPTVVLPLALSCSCAMILPVSTPPNAVVFAGGKLKSSDFIPGGILIAITGPVVIYMWTKFIV